MSSNDVKNEINNDEASALVEQLTSYIYGTLVLLGLTIVMLIIHVGLAFFFHELSA
jgi:hypothetical protein